MKRNTIIYNVLLVAVLIFPSCNEFLDQMPDNRTTITNADQLSKLLVSAYPSSNYSLIAELSADNFVDNNSPEVSIANNLSSFERMHDEIFAWEPVTSSSEEDSPFTVWEKCYKSIATANEVLQTIEELEEENPSIDFNTQKGEALMIRAYGHFILVNIFCQSFKDYELSKADLGIPYITKPETVVNLEYERGTVAEVYAKIEADIKAGIDLVNDEAYDVPKYHFNEGAAHAFAARFYLYTRDYEKVLYHANKVLGSNPSLVLRDWSKTYSNSETESYAYISSGETANLLVLPTYSTFFRIFYKTRYGFNGSAKAALAGGGPLWNSWLPSFSGGWWWTYDQEFGAFCSKVYEQFEYTDKIAGIGFAHVVRTEFTTDETLLCRAEARLFLDQKEAAVDDLNIWCQSHKVSKPLTEEKIKNYYTAGKTAIVKELNSQKMSNSFVVNDDIEPIVQCILHFRRIESVFEGLRWFDIKRYGIEITHFIGSSEVDVLKWDDSRRAIQIPQDVIAAGIEANPTQINSVNDSNVQPLKRD